MFSFDSKDFTKSALSLTAGMLIVIALLTWKTEGDFYFLIMLSGIPMGVLSLWAFYECKMRLQAHLRSAQVKQRVQEAAGRPPQHFRRLSGKLERRTLGAMNEVQKNRIMGGRPREFIDPEEHEETNQWYRG